MSPTIESGDWLLVDPTTARWPRAGSIVVFREPDTDVLAIKRVAAGPGARVELDAGHLILGPDEAWLLSDASAAELIALGFGEPVDWYPEDQDEIEATRELYVTLTFLLSSGYQVDLLDQWHGSPAEAITTLDVSLSEVPEKAFRLFENYKFRLNLGRNP